VQAGAAADDARDHVASRAGETVAMSDSFEPDRATELVLDVPEASRYELRIGDATIGRADYWIDGDVMVISHVETRRAHRGVGNAARLMDGVIADARRRGMRIRPICSYAAAHLRQHPEREDVVASR
jgi:predicted GNAT family acetyltransferase